MAKRNAPKHIADEDWRKVEERLLYYKRTAPPRPPNRTASLYLRGMGNAVVAAFKRYCRRHGYQYNAAVEALMREATQQDKPLNIRGITPGE